MGMIASGVGALFLTLTWSSTAFDQPILLDDPSHPPRRRTDAFVPKPGLDLASAFALKGTRFDLCFDMNKQILLSASADRPGPEGWFGVIWIRPSHNPMTIDSGA